MSQSYSFSTEHKIAIAGIVGLGQRSIDYSSLVFETPEQFISSNFIYPDISLGVYYKSRISEILNLNIGAATYHINTPDYSFYQDNNVQLRLKNNFHFETTYQYRKSILLIYEG